MEKIIKQIAELLAFIPLFEKQNVVVSNATIGWQIDHSLKVINQVISSLLNSNPEDYVRKFNWRKSWVFISKKIPRGKVRAPKSVLPTEEITETGLMLSIEQAKENIRSLGNCEPRQFFIHPFFGQVNVGETKTFIQIHTEHHLKIIRDICK